METATSNRSKGVLWTSYILQGAVILMFAMGAINNLVGTEMAVKVPSEWATQSRLCFI